ncbi:putative Rieske (2Fe-2S) iron-sulfur domain protein [[Clostridium] ultunense Esp]|uniref:hypothetical protein n=1 Tax=Thermicanus aegyptius TaxID=94009 RepID=UPI0002B6FC76|nr:hypothetical protein [Thermicanus aegyptius]CCQ97301.1 putative Rieske (2Fe-2S) iron-sulfur domain protein [[Clostridium] ultunense Esp]
MNRLEFLRELKKSLIDTVKEVSLPFLEEDAKKIEETVDRLIGVTWVSTGIRGKLEGEQVESVRLGKKEFFLYKKNKEETRGVENRCPECGSLLHYLSYRRRLKCLSCDKDFHLDTEEGELHLTPAPMKQEEEIWFIGVKKDA